MHVVFFNSPYTRQTYRYTPLLALILAPNEWLHPSFGKYLFAGCDIINGALIYKILIDQVLSRRSVVRNSRSKSPKRDTSDGEDEASTNGDVSSLATLYASLHLLNPLVFGISTRGSNESVLSTLVLVTLWCALRGKWDAAAVSLGLATHWKIYPVIYGVACLGAVSYRLPHSGTSAGDGWRRLINAKTIRFGVLSAGTFALLGLGCYLV